MFRLAHLSDIHLGPLPRFRKRDLMSKRITGYLNWRRNRAKAMGNSALNLILDDIEASAPDHIAVTGDLVNLSLDEEIKAGRLWLDGLGEPHDVTFVPGNHDAYVLGALKKTVRELRPYITGDSGPAGSRIFPALRVRDKVAIIGVNSARATPAFIAAGHFSERQAAALEALLERTGEAGLCRVILIHHPPVRGATTPSKRLFGITRFQNVIRRAGAELVLHGHTHLETLNWIKAQAGDVPVLGVAAAGQMPGGPRPAASWNDITIEPHPAGGFSISAVRRGLSQDARSVEVIGQMTLSRQPPVRAPETAR
ncbi:MAG: metallophosphoesterase [Rhizobiaceae bacterium]|jgi:3',5'-cyclic AMP phosphodiesterase CpdA|nr:metallophosphoesterase [Rhizobiaceae bacterium]